MLLTHHDRLAAVARFDESIAVTLQDPARNEPDLIVILDEQDHFVAAKSRQLARLDGRARYFVGARQIDFEGRPGSELAVHPDAATALFHDSEHGRKSKPGPLALFLRGEERLEDALLRLLV